MIRVKDIGRVELGALNYQQYGTFNGQPAAVVAAYQAPTESPSTPRGR